jgi:hypothetical protein
MRFYSTIEEIAATPSYLLAIFIVFTLAMHAALVWWGRLSDIAWKRADYIWTATAAVGLVASAYTADRVLSARYTLAEMIRTESAYSDVRRYLETGSSSVSWLVAPHLRTPFSPPDFEAIERARSNLLELLRTWISWLPKDVEVPFPSLHELASDLDSMDRKYVGLYVADLRDAVRSYEEHSTRSNDLSISSERSPWHLLIVVEAYENLWRDREREAEDLKALCKDHVDVNRRFGGKSVLS